MLLCTPGFLLKRYSIGSLSCRRVVVVDVGVAVVVVVVVIVVIILLAVAPHGISVIVFVAVGVFAAVVAAGKEGILREWHIWHALRRGH